jgi:hypothetical protein
LHCTPSHFETDPGPLGSSLPAITTVDPVLSLVIGVAVFDERFRNGPADLVGEVIGLALVIVAAVGPHRLPPASRVVLATLTSIVGSLAADAILVVLGEAVFPGTKGYVHWLFFRLAVLVTLFLWLPDLYILHQGQPAKAVGVLRVMHLAIALVTYNLLVRAAPVRHRRSA